MTGVCWQAGRGFTGSAPAVRSDAEGGMGTAPTAGASYLVSPSPIALCRRSHQASGWSGLPLTSTAASSISAGCISTRVK